MSSGLVPVSLNLVVVFLELFATWATSLPGYHFKVKKQNKQTNLVCWMRNQGCLLQEEKPASHLTLHSPGHPLQGLWMVSCPKSHNYQHLWSICNALVRNLIQENNQRTEMGIYFFTFPLIQLDNIIRGRSPHMLVVSGWCMVGVDRAQGWSTPVAPVWSPLLPAVLHEPVIHAANITQITHTAVPAPISHVIFETSNILSLLINTVIMACQGFMLFLK